MARNKAEEIYDDFVDTRPKRGNPQKNKKTRIVPKNKTGGDEWGTLKMPKGVRKRNKVATPHNLKRIAENGDWDDLDDEEFYN